MVIGFNDSLDMFLKENTCAEAYKTSVAEQRSGLRCSYFLFLNKG